MDGKGAEGTDALRQAYECSMAVASFAVPTKSSRKRSAEYKAVSEKQAQASLCDHWRGISHCCDVSIKAARAMMSS